MSHQKSAIYLTHEISHATHEMCLECASTRVKCKNKSVPGHHSIFIFSTRVKFYFISDDIFCARASFHFIFPPIHKCVSSCHALSSHHFTGAAVQPSQMVAATQPPHTVATLSSPSLPAHAPAATESADTGGHTGHQLVHLQEQNRILHELGSSPSLPSSFFSRSLARILHELGSFPSNCKSKIEFFTDSVLTPLSSPPFLS